MLDYSETRVKNLTFAELCSAKQELQKAKSALSEETWIKGDLARLNGTFCALGAAYYHDIPPNARHTKLINGQDAKSNAVLLLNVAVVPLFAEKNLGSPPSKQFYYAEMQNVPQFNDSAKITLHDIHHLFDKAIELADHRMEELNDAEEEDEENVGEKSIEEEAHPGTTPTLQREESPESGE